MERQPRILKKGKKTNKNIRKNHILDTVNERAKAQNEHDKLKRLMSANRAQQLQNEPLEEFFLNLEDKDEQFNQKFEELIERNRALQEALDISEETVQNRLAENPKYKPPRYEKRVSGVVAMRRQAEKDKQERYEEKLRRRKPRKDKGKKRGPRTKKILQVQEDTDLVAKADRDEDIEIEIDNVADIILNEEIEQFNKGKGEMTFLEQIKEGKKLRKTKKKKKNLRYWMKLDKNKN